jgi:hypothetical protein
LEGVLLLLERGIVGVLLLESGVGILLLEDSFLAFLHRFGKLEEFGIVNHGTYFFFFGGKVWKRWVRMMAIIPNVVG